MLTYSHLREIQKKEMESLELVKIEKDFYVQLRQFIETKKVSALKIPSFMEMRELENIRKVAKSIVAKRKEKLLTFSAISLCEIEGLAEEEQIFLSKMKKIAKEEFAGIDTIFEDSVEEIDKTKLKIVKAIDAYKGSDNNIYGPFKEGEEIFLPEEEAEWLLKSKMAEHIR